MQYGTRFNDTHNLDWGIQQTKPAEISEPDPDLYLVKVPGADAPLDLSETPTGRVTYGQRTARIPFVCRAPRSSWPALRSKISSEIHGQRKTIVFDDDPEHFWEGRTYLDWGKTDEKISFPEISAKLDPFRWDMALYSITKDFSFYTAFQFVSITDGSNVSKQSWNTDLRFGTKNIPTHDFSLYTQLSITATPKLTRMEPALQFVDGDGHVYNATDMIEPVNGTGPVAWSVGASDLEEAGLDLSKIYRILITNGVGVVMSGMVPGLLCTVPGGKRNRELEIEVPTEGVSVVFRGREYPLVSGMNRITDFELLEGENSLIFKATSVPLATEQIKIQYRRGWL